MLFRWSLAAILSGKAIVTQLLTHNLLQAVASRVLFDRCCAFSPTLGTRRALHRIFVPRNEDFAQFDLAEFVTRLLLNDSAQSVQRVVYAEMVCPF